MMTETIFTLVFASALLVLMIYPAIKIVEFFDTKAGFSEKTYNVLTVIVTMLLALGVGIFMNYAEF